ANRPDLHLRGFDPARDLDKPRFADIRRARAGDRCPRCGGAIEICRGIEVGHIFELGDVYTRPMDVSFQDRDGARKHPVMGCYGIGVSRLLAAIVEQHHDAGGIAWPAHLAPYAVAVIPIGAEAIAPAERIYTALTDAGVEALLDDRDERPGVKFADMELIGIPVQVVIGKRTLAENAAEVGLRRAERRMVPLDEAAEAARRAWEEACRGP
ncbi:MAG: proline--tRNA ligase, partial [Zetaproteobacteria bacterium]